MNTLISGAAFGAALTASGVYQPSVIVGQLRLENWHMIQAFLTATAGSAILVTIAQKIGHVPLSPRSLSTVGLFSRADGNILGGLLLGTGMGLSGACPGTVIAQVAMGVRAGYYALSGAVLGGIFWSGVLAKYLNIRRARSKNEGAACEEALTIRDGLGITHASALALFEGICAAVVAATVAFGPSSPETGIHPVLGGAIIASAQLLSLLLRKSLVGVSASYSETGDLFWGFLRGKFPRSYMNIFFSAGIFSGSWILGRALPQVAQATAVSVTPLWAGLGGFLMVIGARMAGGCTSGHGISGMALLSTSSIITIGVAFGWGALVVRLL